MRKKIRNNPRRYIILGAVLIGLGVGGLMIPKMLNTHDKKTDVVETVNAPTESEVVSDAALLDNKNWVVYTSDEYKFAFKYPKGFVMNVFNEPNQEIDRFTGVSFGRMVMPERTLYREDLEHLGYVIYSQVDSIADVKAFSKEMESFKENPTFNKTEQTINGQKAVRYDGVGIDSGQTVVAFEHNKSLYKFTLYRYETNNEVISHGEQVFEQMLNSIYFAK